MDPFARKMIRNTLLYALGMLLLFAAMTAVFFHIKPECPDRTIGAFQSPGGNWVAEILQRRCGEDAPFITHVNLRPAATRLERGFFTGQAKQGDIFLVEQDAAGAGLKLTWTAHDQLTITCPHCNPAYTRRADPQWGTVTIHYELPPG
jgi:hypothetical protein